MCMILIVDDDSEVRELARRALTESGHDVYEAENGHDALVWLTAHPHARPCLALVDLMMPVMDGWDFVAAIRNQIWAPQRLIMLSGRIQSDSPPPVLSAHAYWPKPLELERLEGIHRHCPTHGASWPPPPSAVPEGA
jgi:CheY-like chemotaxis protein